MKNMKALRQSLLHMVPLIVLCALILGVMYLAGNTEDVRQAAIPMLFLVLGSGVEKFARASPSVPMKDYVNE